MHADLRTGWAVVLERLAVASLLFAACVPRARELQDPLENAGGPRAAALVTEIGREDTYVAALTFECWALVAHLVAAGALARLLQVSHGTPAALFALALWGTQPVALLHGSLVGPENAGLACGLVGLVCGVRWALDGGLENLAGVLVLGLAGSLFGWTAWSLLAALLAGPVLGKRWRAYLGVLAVVGAVTALVPGLLQPGRSTLGAVARSPLEAFGLPALGIALVGVGMRLARVRSPETRARLDELAVGPPPRADLTLPLLLGGLGAWWLVSDPSWVLLTPAVAAAGAGAYVQLSRPLLRMRAGLAPVVAAVALVAVPGLAGFEHMRAELDPPSTPVEDAP